MLLARIGSGFLALLLVFALTAPAPAQSPRGESGNDGEQQSATADAGEPSRALLTERLAALHAAVSAADAEAVWGLIDAHSHDKIRELHAALKERVEGLAESQRERTPPGWAESDSLGDLLTMDAKEFLAVFLRSREGRDAAQRLGRIEGVERVLLPDRDHFWVLRLIDYGRREERRRIFGPQADEGRIIHFTVAGENLQHPPTTAIYEDGRWRIRLFPDD